MKVNAMICRALSGHAWEIVGPIVVLKDDARRITFHCPRCECWRSDTWHKNGGRIATRYYKHSTEYHEFIKTHNRAEAREALLGAQKEVKANETNNSRVRLVSGRGKTARRRATNARKRPRDKRRANG